MKNDLIIPTTPIEKMTKPILRFLQIEAAGGVVLLCCTLLALFIANSPWAESFFQFWHIPLAVSFADFQISHSLGHWINDGLMTIFFFVVGLEIKREIVSGELKEKRAAALPIMAALGGMIVPAIFYSLAIRGHEGSTGWGIPMATDIAFVIGFLSLFGKRVPHGLKIFVLSLAIVDDLGAIIVIATAYSSNISFVALIFGFVGLGVTGLFNRLGVRRIPIYFLIGMFVWIAFSLSGIHPTISGVLLGLLTPAKAWTKDKTLLDVLMGLPEKWENSQGSPNDKQKEQQVNTLIKTARETVSPLERLQGGLHPWVAFLIMPLFALSNAGVPIDLSAATSTVSLAVSLGLIFGKPIGIFLFSWLAVRFLGAKLPSLVNWKIILGAGFLGGVGFTMSMFIANLALHDDFLVAGKVGTLLGSATSTIFGLSILYFVLPKSTLKV